MIIFWETVKKEIKQQNTSFEWLYAKTNIPKGTIATWKKRNILPRADDALSIAHALGVSLEYLLTGTREGTDTSQPELQHLVDSFSELDTVDREVVQYIIDKLKEKS